MGNAYEDLKQEMAVREVAEIALQESEQRFKMLGENCPEIIFTLDCTGTFTYVNPAWKRILGHRTSEVIGKQFIKFSKRENVRTYTKLFKRIRDNRETIQNVSNNLIHRDGSARIFSLSGAPNLDNEGLVRGIVGFLKDITEYQMLQAKIQRAQKMEAVGTLAGGIAHDFNNILQGVHGYVELLLLKNSKEESGCRELEEVKRVVQRGSKLTKQLLTFSRRVESELRPVDLNQELTQIQGMLKRVLPKMIEIETRFEEDLSLINADPAQIEQVIMNLAINARDAMVDGGKLIIETKNATPDEEFCKKENSEARKYIRLSMSDNGQGIEKEKLEKIFNPFFTTKKIGKGTGLGLAMVYGIVKSHGGHIICESEPDKGTTFKIYIPALMQVAAPAKENIGEGVPMVGDCTILIIDDERSIRDFCCQIFPQFGYNVLTAPTGEKALDLYKSEYKKIDLLILDLIMPGMGGRKCLEELLKINSYVKVLISSGYSVDEQTRKAIEAGASDFIKKPWETKQILKAINQALH
jgi:PAS domain S-box-containing protein